MLEGKDVRFRHGEDADFEMELALEARIEDAATPGSGTDRFLVGGLRRALTLPGACAQRPGCGNCVPTKRSHIRSLISRRAPMLSPADGGDLVAGARAARR